MFELLRVCGFNLVCRDSSYKNQSTRSTDIRGHLWVLKTFFHKKKTYYTRLNRHTESLFLIHFKFLHYLQLIFILSRYIYKQMHFIIYIDKITISSRFGCHSKVWWSMQNILGKEWLRLFRFCDLSRSFHVKSLSNWWHCSEIVFFVL